jgi:hypothetical protein
MKILYIATYVPCVYWAAEGYVEVRRQNLACKIPGTNRDIAAWRRCGHWAVEGYVEIFRTSETDLDVRSGFSHETVYPWTMGGLIQARRLLWE